MKSESGAEIFIILFAGRRGGEEKRMYGDIDISTMISRREGTVLYCTSSPGHLAGAS